MIYNKDSPSILGGFGITPEEQTELAGEYLVGNRGEILLRLCSSDLPPNKKYSLLVEFGSRLALDEMGEIARQHEEYLRNEHAESGRIEDEGLSELRTESDEND